MTALDERVAAPAQPPAPPPAPAQVQRPRRSTPRWSLRLPIAATIATVLASICLGETFTTARWFFPTAFAVVVVGAACEIARRRSLPRAVVPLVGLLALVTFLVLRYAREEATLGLLPDLSALERLVLLVDRGNQEMARFAAPISVSPGIELITVGGVGLIALAVDTLAVTLRRAALAGLPLLALYTVPAALAPDGVNWQAFVLAASGYLGLLVSESRERVSRWGRPLRYTPRSDWQDEVQTAPLARLGRRVGAAAIALALAIPAVFPEITLGGFGLSGVGFGRGNGIGDRVAVINPIVDLGRDLRRGDNRTVIRYSGTPTYLRMVGLDVFDGTTWKPSTLKVENDQTLENGLPRPPGLAPEFERGRKSHKIEVADLDQQWLPLPYPARKVTIDGRWLYDTDTFNVFSTNTSTRQKSYRVSSRSVTPTAELLRNAVRPSPGAVDRYLQLPLRLPDVVKRTAEEVTRDAATDYDRALALQEWLRSPSEFTYSTKVPRQVGDGNGSESVAAFLQARTGYCVHFASTMAIMARQLGIPARVAIGFTAGTRNASGDYIVGLHDAHSWPELYFEGAGWTAFEPTPAARTGSPPAWAQPASEQPEETASPSASASPSSSASSTFNRNTGENEDFVPGGADDNSAKPLWQRLRLPLVPTLIVLTLIGLALLPALLRVGIRRRRWRGATTPPATVTAAWDELQDSLLDHGFVWNRSDSPRRGAARAAAVMSLPGNAADSIARIAAAAERLHYASALGSVGDLRGDVGVVTSALRAQGSRWRRLRARVLPRSTRYVAADLAERCADVLDAIDAGAAKMRARLVPKLGRSG